MYHSFYNIKSGIFTYEVKTTFYDAISYTRKMSFLNVSEKCFDLKNIYSEFLFPQVIKDLRQIWFKKLIGQSKR